jgi:hypothetical protein
MAAGIDSTKHTLERLLRMEIIASDSYDSVIRRLDAPTQQGQLEDLRRDHDLAVGRLRNLLASMHDGGSLRGLRLLTAAVRGISGLVGMLGSTSVLRALRSGERAVLERLEHFDGDARLLPEARALISDELLPRARAHVGALDRLITA